MYYPDLTPYSFLANHRSPNALNIGWLDKRHSFSTKKASEGLLDALFDKCLHFEHATRGFHQCEFCDDQTFGGLEVVRHGIENTLGSAEITVMGEDGIEYAAPNLIYHYVAAHDYDPPKEFVEGLFAEEIEAAFGENSPLPHK